MAESRACGRRAALAAVTSNGCLLIVKAVAGLATGSVGILGDAVHSAMDLVGSAISLAAVEKAGSPPDSTHHYGHEKLEDLSAAAQALLLLLGSAFVVYEGVHRLLVGGGVHSEAAGIAVVAVAALVNFVVSTFVRRAAGRTGSPALYATAADLRADAVVSLGVLAALVIVMASRLRWIDPAVGLVIGTAVGSTGVRILRGATRRLADEALPLDELDVITTTVESFIDGEVVSYHGLRARHAGSAHHVDLHLQFRPGLTLERAHELSHAVQDALVAALPGTTVRIHIEPNGYLDPEVDDTMTNENASE